MRDVAGAQSLGRSCPVVMSQSTSRHVAGGQLSCRRVGSISLALRLIGTTYRNRYGRNRYVSLALCLKITTQHKRYGSKSLQLKIVRYNYGSLSLWPIELRRLAVSISLQFLCCSKRAMYTKNNTFKQVYSSVSLFESGVNRPNVVCLHVCLFVCLFVHLLALFFWFLTFHFVQHFFQRAPVTDGRSMFNELRFPRLEFTNEQNVGCIGEVVRSTPVQLSRINV